MNQVGNPQQAPAARREESDDDGSDEDTDIDMPYINFGAGGDMY